MRGHRICSQAGRVSTKVSSGQTAVLDNFFHFCCKFSGLYAGVNSINIILQFGVNLIPVFISGFYIVEILRTVLIQSVVCRFTRHPATLPL